MGLSINGDDDGNEEEEDVEERGERKVTGENDTHKNYKNKLVITKKNLRFTL